ncbi:MAG: histidinol dehydrogenase [Rhodobacteraceae bacterium]|nr:histidinol dehydrogenase [Paracoccaceae bacterium]
MTGSIIQEKKEIDLWIAKFIQNSKAVLDSVDSQVTTIIQDVKNQGDEAIIKFSRKFDKIDINQSTLYFNDAEITQAEKKVSKKERKAIELAFSRIKSYHKNQLPSDKFWKDKMGVELGFRWSPLSSIGIYVPGGIASYPSSVLMNAVPAKVAGVKSITMATPTPLGKVNSLVLFAAKMAGVDKIIRVGGAQAIAALAYGTKNISPVDKIVGPGNAYVAAAKRQVFGQVGIDAVTGPSEVLIIADKKNNPKWIAADLLAQSEHDKNSRAILITTCFRLATQVQFSVKEYLNNLAHPQVAKTSWERNGKIIVVKKLEAAIEIANLVAAEHLQICTSEPEVLAEKIHNAGAIFLGEMTPEVFGDYILGSNHVLPTNRTARFSSSLSVLDFMKRTSISKMSKVALRPLGEAAELLAKAETLEAHGLSARLRIEADNDQ